MKAFYRTESGKTLRITESAEGALTIDILKGDLWEKAPIGMIGLRLSAATRRLSTSEIGLLPA
jgi:hypothetical protein